MSFEKSAVMLEFAKIMDSREFPAKNPHQEDKKTIEEKRLFPKEDLVEEAHPEKVYVAEAHGDGGLVENQNEQHEKMMTVINKMPTGSLLGTYASTVNSLVKMADIYDELGEKEVADTLTDTAKKVLALMDNLPFDYGTCDKDSRVSPLNKSAISLFAPIKWLISVFKWIGKFLSEAKYSAGKKIESTDDLVKYLKISRQYAKQGAESKNQFFSDLAASGLKVDPKAINLDVLSADLITESFLSASAESGPGAIVAKNITENAKIANSIWSKQTQTIKNKITAIKNQADMLKREFASKDEKSRKLSVDAYNKQLEKLKLEYQKNIGDLNFLTAQSPKANFAGYYADEVANMEAALKSSELSQRYPEFVSEWLGSTKQTQKIFQEVKKEKSAFLNNNEKFIQEFLKKKGTNRFGYFCANPENAQKIRELSNINHIKKIIAGDEAGIFNLGYTAMRQARNVIGGTGAIGSAIVIVYKWFQLHNSPDKIIKTAEDLDGSLSQLRTSDLVQQTYIVPLRQSLQKAVASHQKILSSIDKMGEEKREEAKQTIDSIGTYLVELNSYINDMNFAIENWDRIGAGIEPEDKQLGEDIKNNLIAELQERTQALNVLKNSYSEIVRSISGTINEADDNLSKKANNLSQIQSLLGLPATGILDNRTEKVIRALESDFNEKSKDNKFTGKFIDANGNYTINFNDLLEALKRIKKY